MNGNQQMQKRVSDEAMSRGAQQLGPGSTLVHSGTAYQSAVTVQVKRDIGDDLTNPDRLGGQVLRRSLAEAHLLGEDFFYAWDVKDRESGGKKQVAGISIDGAMMLLRNWGNAATDVEVVSADRDSYVFKATLIDLETGATCSRLYRKHRSSPPGKYDAQRWDDMQFSDGQSRAIRNVICAALPQWLQNRCLDQAFKSAEHGVNPAAERQAVMARAKAAGVDQKRLEAKMGKPLTQFDASDLVSLRAMLRTIDEGHAKALELFALPDEKKPGTMPADKEGESLASKFAKRIQASPNAIDLGVVGDKVAEAAKQKRLSDADVAELRKLYSARLDVFEAPAPASPSQQQQASSSTPIDGELEPPPPQDNDEYEPGADG